MSILLKLISGLSVIPVKIPAAGCVVDIDKPILKLPWKLKTNTQTDRIAKKSGKKRISVEESHYLRLQLFSKCVGNTGCPSKRKRISHLIL